MKREIKVLLSKIRCHFHKNIILGKESYIDSSSRVYGTSLEIGDYTGIENLIVIGSQPVTIGKYCALAGHLTIISSNHILNKANIQARLQHLYFQDSMDDGSKGPVTIGNNVWIGLHCIILAGVTIGDGAVIGAGSVVTKSVEPFTIAVGNPAKPVRKRFSDATIKKLLKDKWWDWNEEKIKENRAYFIETNM